MKPRLRTDLGNAEMFAAEHCGRLRFVKDRGHWLACEDGRWRPDISGQAERAAKETVRGLWRALADMDPDERKGALKWALDSQSKSRIDAMLRLSATEPEIVLVSDQLDADPWVLACANGVLDLQSGELRSYDPAMLISRGNEIAYDPDPTCPRWLRFLDEVFDGDHELVGFLRRAAGYCLTGDTREQVMFVPHGSGCNGKSTLLETLSQLLGGLSATAPADSFLRSRNDRSIRNDIARLHRARLVTAFESGESRRLDEAMVKQITGGDTVAARFLHQEFFEFKPQFKLWLATNHRPRVDGTDDAIWRRLRLIPFEVSFEGHEDKELDSTLQGELPGILTWAVAGCLEWQRHGLGLPDKVEAVTREYRAEEDVLGLFLSERVELDLEAQVSVADFRHAYEEFCKELGERTVSGIALGRQMSKRGHSSAKDASAHRVYRGLRLAGQEELF